MLSRPSEWLAGRLVVEIGGRISASVCGSLLSQAGATVVFVEPRKYANRAGKFVDRPLFSAGKRSIAADSARPEDVTALDDLLRKADIVLTSSDWVVDGIPAHVPLPENVTICDFTAIGSDGTGLRLTDAEVQALSGVAHTNGFAEGAPVALRVPILEYSAGVYGSAACAAALMAMRHAGQPQRIEVSLFGCAVNALASFLPNVFQGEEPSRLGNGHPLAAPWNAYPTSDGWLLFCTASDVQWVKFCNLVERPDLAVDPRFLRNADRARNRTEVDAIVACWTQRFDTKTCIERLALVGLAGGEIVPLRQLPQEQNVRHRKSIATKSVPETGEARPIPHGILTDQRASPSWQPNVPTIDGDRGWLLSAEFKPLCGCPQVRQQDFRLPLEGMRVIEIGQFTTAPLSARHLAMYGAEIIKIEPPAGDAAREWAPLVDGISVFFSISNAGKTCLKVDLKSAEGRAQIEDLIRDADVLVENLKSGSLAALGFDADRLSEINPRLVYCPITGFGNRSAYPGRPAFDTVIQAMSGMMDANATDEMPLKAGVSVCDFMGGEVSLFSAIAALYERQNSGRGTALDLSMQDIAIWMTASVWNQDEVGWPDNRTIKCRDGYVLVSGKDTAEDTSFYNMTRAQALSQLHQAGAHGVPVHTISEALKSRIGQRLQPVRQFRTARGSTIPLLVSPVTMAPIRLKLGDPPGEARAL